MASTHTGGINMTLSDGSVHFATGSGDVATLQALAQELRRSGHGATAIALGPQGAALQATLAGLRRWGVALGQPSARPFIGEWPALLVWPSAQAPAPTASGIGFISAPAGPVAIGPLIPAIQKVRESAARMQMKFPMRLVMVQDMAHGGPSDSYAFNFTHLRD
jgi:hypothetical protein